jgi:predicted DCC family thiol-disulfide oxidoreductase YuxK
MPYSIMEIKENTPIVLFDNQCYLCTKFAKFVNAFARGKIMMIGHYSDFGLKIRNEILDEFALEMFWFIDKKRASGGRAALYPLIKLMLSKNVKKSKVIKIDEKCQQDCKTIKAVFVRSSSLLRNSRQIDLK